jgi:hypothetical protein
MKSILLTTCKGLIVFSVMCFIPILGFVIWAKREPIQFNKDSLWVLGLPFMLYALGLYYQAFIDGPDKKVDTGKISDGYHTFDELYDHRITVYIALCYELWNTNPYIKVPVWRTIMHSDGSVWDGWFILGIFEESGKQITYHLPMKRWEECFFAKELAKAPEFDGHTSKDVLLRIEDLKKL